MNLPENLKLPFFAYGLFKPGQICYYRIEEFASNNYSDSIDGYLKERDGVPILVNKSQHGQVNGSLIYFDQQQKAYESIVLIEPEEVYQWEEVILHSGERVNVLHGRKVDRGSSDLEHCQDWDNRDDPYFTQALEVVEEILNQNQDLDYKALFRLQMAYTLLWTSIERFSGLKYNLGKKITVTKKVCQISKEESFVLALKRHVQEKRFVYDTLTLDKCTLDPDNAEKSIKYYYQVRSNIVHRGKAVHKDFEILKLSTTELLGIYRDVLQATVFDTSP